MSTHETVRALLAKYGDETGRDVYDQPAAFAAFVRGGGNVVLYERLSARLADGYDKTQPETLLDIGCGDGLALVPTARATCLPGSNLVEPSVALLDAATKRLADVHTEVHTWQQPRRRSSHSWKTGVGPCASDVLTPVRPVRGTRRRAACPSGAHGRGDDRRIRRPRTRRRQP
jgi:hypothetical protein